MSRMILIDRDDFVDAVHLIEDSVVAMNGLDGSVVSEEEERILRACWKALRWRPKRVVLGKRRRRRARA